MSFKRTGSRPVRRKPRRRVMRANPVISHSSHFATEDLTRLLATRCNAYCSKTGDLQDALRLTNGDQVNIGHEQAHTRHAKAGSHAQPWPCVVIMVGFFKHAGADPPHSIRVGGREHRSSDVLHQQSMAATELKKQQRRIKTQSIRSICRYLN
jgi:hypothetical protein